ncbi:MAG: dihydroorotate dehydrogenase (quinone) [Azorhizobium sp. 39-67-5]|nr:MAG: dihydroorotate dehydrogenase (quinone) [Azorhizobium sp. 39-67-5]
MTPLPQPGNPRPRLFRLEEDEGVINRFGFNSQGLQPFVERLARRRGTGIVGVNLGKNKQTEDAAEDYERGIAATAKLADYLVCNLSSPNTPGLRALQGRSAMRDLVARAITARDAAVPDAGKRPPLLVKIAPDLDDAALEDVSAVARDTGVDGIILGNTTISRPPGLRSAHREEAGGLSGRPLFALSTERLRVFARMLEGRIPLIGCGGVTSGADAYAKIRAGATLVQLYSALVFGGPVLVGEIKRDLTARLKADGFRSVSDAVGADLRKKGLNRIGNLIVPNANYCAFEDWVVPILDKMLEEQEASKGTDDEINWTPSKVIHRLGKEINDERSVYYWAYKNNIPVFCPALTDGSLGDMLYFHTFKSSPLQLKIDIVEDIRAFLDGKPVRVISP